MYWYSKFCALQMTLNSELQQTNISTKYFIDFPGYLHRKNITNTS